MVNAGTINKSLRIKNSEKRAQITQILKTEHILNMMTTHTHVIGVDYHHSHSPVTLSFHSTN